MGGARRGWVGSPAGCAVTLRRGGTRRRSWSLPRLRRAPSEGWHTRSLPQSPSSPTGWCAARTQQRWRVCALFRCTPSAVVCVCAEQEHALLVWFPREALKTKKQCNRLQHTREYGSGGLCGRIPVRSIKSKTAADVCAVSQFFFGLSLRMPLDIELVGQRPPNREGIHSYRPGRAENTYQPNTWTCRHNAVRTPAKVSEMMCQGSSPSLSVVVRPRR